MRIKNNISSLNAQIALKINESKLTKDLEKLTSGYRINRSGDDAAGLAISEQMRSQIAGLTQGELNARDGLGLLRTGEGAMQEIHAMLIRMNGLTIRSANGVYTDEDHRELIQEEVDRISQEIDRIASATRFNYVNLFHDDKDMAADSGLTAPGTTGTTTKAAPGTTGVTTTAVTGTTTTAVTGTPDAAATAASPITTANNVQMKMPAMPGTGSTAGDTDAQTETAEVAFDLPGVDTSDSDGAEKTEKELKEETVQTSAVENVTYNGAMGDRAAQAAGLDNRKTEQMLKTLSGSPSKADTTNPAANTLPAAGTMPSTASLTTKAVSTAKQSSKIVFQIGPDAEHTISIPRFYLSKAALGLNDFDVSTQEAAKESIGKVEDMINYVSQIRGAYGAVDNALEHAMNSMNVYKENLTAAESRIRDTDMAKELTERTKDQILAQTAQAMLAQANALPESTLSLLQ